jgi:hypothetical protein
MKESRLDSFAVPSVTTTDDVGKPALVVQATKTPLRVVVRNISLGSTVLLAHDGSALQSAPAFAGVYNLPAGQSDIFVVMPGQKLFAATPGANGQISVAISEAIPVDTRS